MDQIKLGKFIANVRTERGITQDELAEKIGVSSGKVVSKWECGNTMPDFETLIEISKVLKVTLYELSICKKIDNPTLIDKTKNKFYSYRQLLRENIKNKILIISSIILGLIFGFATIFMINNYKTIEIYDIRYSPQETKFRIKGNIFIAKDYAIFNLIKINTIDDNIEYLNNDASNIQYEILDNKSQRILSYTKTNQEDINNEMTLSEIIKTSSFSLKIKKEMIPKDPNLKLKIAYNDERNLPKEIIINFKIDKIFENTL